MNVNPNHTDDEINQLSKSWATLFACAIVVAVALSYAAEPLAAYLK